MHHDGTDQHSWAPSYRVGPGLALMLKVSLIRSSRCPQLGLLLALYLQAE